MVSNNKETKAKWYKKIIQIKQNCHQIYNRLYK
jgi:hypothetical protein